ncbi:MAG: hypothetical protein HC902_08985 [Calothrix sp. SM1_5_4]|nr:hypothetical protein [Calothrix sp. SM1_5_4]
MLLSILATGFADAQAIDIDHIDHIDYVDQNIHQRVLFGDGWRGAYVKGFINKEWDKVRFEYCGSKRTSGGAYLMNQCDHLLRQDLRVAELESHKEDFLNRLLEVRNEIKSELGIKPWRAWTGRKHDLIAIDRIITSIRHEGLTRWLFLRKNHEKEHPRFFSAAICDRVAAAITTVMTPAKKAPPSPPAPSRDGPQIVFAPEATATSR